MDEQNELELNEDVVEAEYTEVEESLTFVSEDEEEQVVGVEDNYGTIDKDVVYVDPNTGEQIDPNNLGPFEKIKFIANQLGQTLDEPQKNCKHCYGRGYTAIDAKSKLPVACSCIYKTFRKTNPNWQNAQTPSTNRSAKRAYYKKMGKLISKMRPAYEKEQELKEKSKENLGKNTPNYVPKHLRESNVETIELSDIVSVESEPTELTSIDTPEGVIGVVE
jgi:hypothetical protein